MSQSRWSKEAFSRNILMIELLGFAFIFAMFWVNEWTDLPSLVFGTVETPFNWAESVIETVILVVVAVPLLFFTRHELARSLRPRGGENMDAK